MRRSNTPFGSCPLPVLLLLCGLAVISVLSCSPAASAGNKGPVMHAPPPPPAPAPKDAGKNPAKTQRYMVTLRVADYERLARDSQQGRPGADAALSAAVAETTRRVAKDLEGKGVRLLQGFQFSPTALFEATSQGLKALRKHPLVKGAEQEQLARPQGTSGTSGASGSETPPPPFSAPQ